MASPAENAATVRDYLAKPRADWLEAATSLDALLAQAEAAEMYKADRDKMAERDAARKLAVERADALFAAQDECRAMETRIVELVEGHDLERISRERDAAVRAAEQAREALREIEAMEDGSKAIEHAAEVARAALTGEGT